MTKIEYTKEKIKETQKELIALKKVEKHQLSVINQYNEVVKLRIDLENRLNKELRDIQNLEKLGVKSIFYKVLGSKEQQLEKERQEYLQVSLQLKEVIEEEKVLDFEKEVLENKLSQIKPVEDRLAELMKKRNYEILASTSPLKNELQKYYLQIDQKNQFEVELDEAIASAQLALQRVRQMEGFMAKAKKWGNWDMASKNSLQYDYLKKSNIDKAMQLLPTAKIALRNLNAELKDVGYSSQRFALRLDQINNFTSMFFDNLITDWIVQGKIKSALGTLERLSDEIDLTIKNLEKDKQNLQMDISDIQSSIDEILLNH